MKICTDYRLPPEQYFKQAQEKKQIVLHHTVGGSAISTFKWWLQDPQRIGCAYIIERDGTIYEIFDPIYWAHHLGLRIIENITCNRQSIGIELASEGALVKKDDGLLYAYDGKKLQHDKYVDLGYIWRGYRYFDAYEDKQIDSIIWLVNYLCERFGIPKRTIPGDKSRYDISLINFSGVISHCNLRNDKTDVHPMFPYNLLFNNSNEA